MTTEEELEALRGEVKDLSIKVDKILDLLQGTGTKIKDMDDILRGALKKGNSVKAKLGERRA